MIGQSINRSNIDNGFLDSARFIIIRGAKRHGKTHLAKYIARHYKLTYIQLDNKVNTIRELVRSSNYNNNCLYHFKDFDKASKGAKGALLKITEETPEGVKIVITTSKTTILPTLTSRAYIMDIQPYTEKDIQDYLELKGISDDIKSTIKGLNLTLTPSLLSSIVENKETFSQVVTLTSVTIKAIKRGLKVEDASSIATKFWNIEKEQVELYLKLLSQGILESQSDILKKVRIVQQVSSKISYISLNSYKQIIHNMLMEMI